MLERDITIKPNFWDKIKNHQNKYVHIIMIWTKPDIIKQAPLYIELKKRSENIILIHTWQHYDYTLSKWVLNEFWMEVDIELNIIWNLHEKYSSIIHKLWDIFIQLQNCNKIPVPYVHWDTLTATTASKAAFLNKIWVVHVEAWIRTLTPKKEFYHNLFKNYDDWNFEWSKYYKSLQDKSIYELWSIEPYPEQFDTRWILASTWFHAAPVEFNRETLIWEWVSNDYIKVVWNTIVDAIGISKKKIWESKAFEMFPNMKDKPFIFVTVHRRENTEVKERFLAIYYGLKKLIQDWIYVCFLSLNASEVAIDKYWLRQDLRELIKNYPENFAYWQPLAHHHEVIDMLLNAWALVTDSWSMQEEANILWTPSVTLRFGSDRSETYIEWVNIIAPPVNSNLIADIVKWVILNNNMVKKNHLYWENVSAKIVDQVLEMLEKDWALFRLDDKRLNLESFFNWKI